MSAFDGVIKTKLAVPDPLTDHKLPNSRSLSFKTVTEKTALAGTKGTHCDLIHGDHHHQLNGNLLQNVRLNSTTAVFGNHRHEVSGNQNLSVLGNALHTHLGTCTKTYIDNKIESCSKHRFTSIPNNSDFSYMTAQYAGFGLQVQVFVTQIQLYGIYITIVTSPLLAGLADAGLAAKANADSPGSSPGGGGAVAAGAVAQVYPLLGMQISLNSGLNLSINYLNVAANWLYCSDNSFKAQMNYLAGRIQAGAANVSAAAASVAAQIGIPAHVPLFGSST